MPSSGVYEDKAFIHKINRQILKKEKENAVLWSGSTETQPGNLPHRVLNIQKILPLILLPTALYSQPMSIPLA